jgi:hypothetical protein
MRARTHAAVHARCPSLFDWLPRLPSSPQQKPFLHACTHPPHAGSCCMHSWALVPTPVAGRPFSSICARNALCTTPVCSARGRMYGASERLPCALPQCPSLVAMWADALPAVLWAISCFRAPAQRRPCCINVGRMRPGARRTVCLCMHVPRPCLCFPLLTGTGCAPVLSCVQACSRRSTRLCVCVLAAFAFGFVAWHSCVCAAGASSLSRVRLGWG